MERRSNSWSIVLQCHLGGWEGDSTQAPPPPGDRSAQKRGPRTAGGGQRNFTHSAACRQFQERSVSQCLSAFLGRTSEATPCTLPLSVAIDSIDLRAAPCLGAVPKILPFPGRDTNACDVVNTPLLFKGASGSTKNASAIAAHARNTKTQWTCVLRLQHDAIDPDM
eukprot:1501673-Rhodomonas_salina.1